MRSVSFSAAGAFQSVPSIGSTPSWTRRGRPSTPGALISPVFTRSVSVQSGSPLAAGAPARAGGAAGWPGVCPGCERVAAGFFGGVCASAGTAPDNIHNDARTAATRSNAAAKRRRDATLSTIGTSGHEARDCTPVLPDATTKRPQPAP